MVAILCMQLARKYEMEVVCDGQGEMPARVEAAGARVHMLPLTTKWSFAARVPQLGALLRSRKPRIVHLHGQFAGSLSQPALRLAALSTVVYTAQWPSYLDDGGPWSRLRNRIAEKVSCAGSSAVVAVSASDEREFLSRGLCDRSKLTVIHNAYFLDDDSARERSPEPPLIGFVGRLVDQKGCEYLVRAAPMVLAAHPDARFVIIGDGPERPRLEALAGDLGVAAAIDFAGYDPHPATRMRTMTALAVPSIYEPLGMVALEAMVCGVPVVGSNVGGIPEAVEDGRTGLLVPPRDPSAIAGALDVLISKPELARHMGEAGHERATGQFSPHIVAGKYDELYRRMLATSS